MRNRATWQNLNQYKQTYLKGSLEIWKDAAVELWLFSHHVDGSAVLSKTEEELYKKKKFARDLVVQSQHFWPLHFPTVHIFDSTIFFPGHLRPENVSQMPDKIWLPPVHWLAIKFCDYISLAHEVYKIRELHNTQNRLDPQLSQFLDRLHSVLVTTALINI